MAHLAERFGPYRILRELGEGGMGTVYLAEDTRDQRRVALKVPQWNNLGSAEAREQQRRRFLREAEATSGIEHRNICPVYDYGEIDGQAYLAMKYVEGVPFDRKITGRQVSPKEAAGLILRIALGMKAIHRAKIIHRDLKPHNVIVDDEGEPVVVDFGLARAIDGSASTLTQTGAFLGTPVYAPPEQFEDARRVSPQADVYSLGAILFQALTGRPPFLAPTLPLLLQKILSEPPPRPSFLCTDVSRALDAICLKALAKKLDARYASMHEFAADLNRFLKDEEPLAVREGGLPISKPVLGGIAAAAALLLVVISLIAFFGGEDAPRSADPAAPAVANAAPPPGPAAAPEPAPPPAAIPAAGGTAPDFTNWTVEQFATALRDGPPAGVTIKPTSPSQFPTTPAGAGALLNLLRAVAAHSAETVLFGPMGQFEGTLSRADAVKAVLHGLALNDSQPALAALRKMAIDGEIDPQVRLTAVAEGLDGVAAENLLARPIERWSAKDSRIACRFCLGDAAGAIAGLKFEDPEQQVAEMTVLLDELSKEATPRPISLGAFNLRPQSQFNSGAAIETVLGRLADSRIRSAGEILESIIDGKRTLPNLSDVGPQSATELYLQWDDDSAARAFLRQVFFRTNPKELAESDWKLSCYRHAGPRLMDDLIAGYGEAEENGRERLMQLVATPDAALVEVQAGLISSGQLPPDRRQEMLGWIWSYVEGACSRRLGAAEGMAARGLSMPGSGRGMGLPRPVVLDDDSLVPGGARPRPSGPTLLGAPGSGGPRSTGTRPLAPAAAPPTPGEIDGRVLAAVSREPFVQALKSRLDDASASREETLRFLAAIPSPTARRAVRESILRSEHAGPAAALGKPSSPAGDTSEDSYLNGDSFVGREFPYNSPGAASRLFGIDWYDPAGLLALKGTDRLKPAASGTASKPIRRPTRLAPKKPAAASPADVKRDWFVATKEFSRTLADRFLEAGRLASVKRTATESLPLALKLPQEARIVLNYTLDWPAAGAAESPVKPLRVHFVQVRFPAQNKSFKSNLEKQLAGQKPRGDDQWLDFLSENDGKAISLDVFVSDLPTESEAIFLLIEGTAADCGM